MAPIPVEPPLSSSAEQVAFIFRWTPAGIPCWLLFQGTPGESLLEEFSSGQRKKVSMVNLAPVMEGEKRDLVAEGRALLCVWGGQVTGQKRAKRLPHKISARLGRVDPLHQVRRPKLSQAEGLGPVHTDGRSPSPASVAPCSWARSCAMTLSKAHGPCFPARTALPSSALDTDTPLLLLCYQFGLPTCHHTAVF